MAGTDGDYDTAIDFLHLLQEELNIPSSDDPVFKAGSEESRNATLNISKLTKPTAWVDTYYPVLNTPVDHSLEILNDDEDGVIWKASLEEIADSELDPDAQKYAEAVPAFHGLSRGGEVRGKLVYANYGRKEDYDELEEKGKTFCTSHHIKFLTPSRCESYWVHCHCSLRRNFPGFEGSNFAFYGFLSFDVFSRCYIGQGRSGTWSCWSVSNTTMFILC